MSEVEEPPLDKLGVKPWYLYIALARTGRFYVGITTDPKQRIKTHNLKNGSKFAVNQGPFRLVYVSKPFLNKSLARKREIQVKGWRREKKIMLIKGFLYNQLTIETAVGHRPCKSFQERSVL